MCNKEKLDRLEIVWEGLDESLQMKRATDSPAHRRQWKKKPTNRANEISLLPSSSLIIFPTSNFFIYSVCLPSGEATTERVRKTKLSSISCFIYLIRRVNCRMFLALFVDAAAQLATAKVFFSLIFLEFRVEWQPRRDQHNRSRRRTHRPSSWCWCLCMSFTSRSVSSPLQALAMFHHFSSVEDARNFFRSILSARLCASRRPLSGAFLPRESLRHAMPIHTDDDAINELFPVPFFKRRRKKKTLQN